jgi:hypothetical protein
MGNLFRMEDGEEHVLGMHGGAAGVVAMCDLG